MTTESTAHATGPSTEENSQQALAYRALRSRIVTCRFRPGQVLQEARVAEMLGLGRTPVRQAFTRLQDEGLVTVHARRGVEVRGFELAELLEIIEARIINESHAARLAAERATPEDVSALGEILIRSTTATDVDETIQLMELDRAFHRRLTEMAGNAVLAGILHNLQDRAIRFWFIASGQKPHRQGVVAQHAEILAAISAGDGAAAQTAMARHIEDLRRSVLRQPGLPAQGEPG